MPKKTIIIIAVILVVVLASGAAVYFFLIRNTKDKPVELYNYAIKDSFVTNVKDSTKLFKVTVILVLNKKGMDDYIETNQYTIRDTILFILRDLTEDDIMSSDIQDKLRVTIPKAINEALNIDNVVSIKFSDFVMQ
ncbi:hypothetical protein SDC9_49964 [bioreactor metagenome]|uniref:Flagellar protein FliL n=1 Tax=bioreactor metagenome TaxID=1076179 RepID=A0A644WJE4_9ZZZZ